MGNEALNNTNTILDSNLNSTPTADILPTTEAAAESKPAISSLNDIQAIPEFQDNYKKNKFIALGSILIGIIVLVCTAVYYYMNREQNQTVEEQPAPETVVMEQNTTTEEAPIIEEAPAGPLDSDPVISEINSDLNGTESEDINKTTEDLEGFDFENIDLELQDNPGL